MMSFYVSFFFFSSRRRHTRCYRDWSSDVCSSDLSPRRKKQATSAHAVTAAIAVRRAPRSIRPAVSAQLEADPLQAMLDVGKGFGKKLVHRAERRRGRVMKEPPEFTDEAFDPRALGGGRAAKAVRQVDDAEARVPRLVAQHERDQLAHQRIGALVLESLEDPHRDPLEEDLHADDLLAIVIGLEEPVNELFERRIERRVDAEFVEVAPEDFDVASLVDDLTGEAELRLRLRDHVEELRTEREGGLLAEEELRERERPTLRAQAIELFARELPRHRRIRLLREIADRPRP